MAEAKLPGAGASRAVRTRIHPREIWIRRADSRAAMAAVDRAVRSLRGGEPVVIAGAGTGLLVLAAETANAERLARLQGLAAGGLTLVLTAQRARAIAIAWPGDDIVALELPFDVGAEAVRALADPTAGLPPRLLPVATTAAPGLAVALDLARLSGLLPAVVAAPARGGPAHGTARVTAEAVRSYRVLGAATLRPVAEARIPLDAGTTGRVIAFRPADGAVEHLAIVIGEPAADAPVLVRLHSQCFTGDLLGSLRCDCGDQLRGAIAAIAQAGAGVIVYLAQEGRGIGLVNKLRAYGLQDRGFDTIEANEQLGFLGDERDYAEAAAMLLLLGFRQIRLLTNNPRKIEALTAHGIEVRERVPHAFPSNRHNQRYLWTKARRGGHMY